MRINSLAIPALALCIGSLAHAEPIRIACVGDSITFGSGIENPRQNGYPAQLEAMLGEGFEVRNFGVPSAGVCRSGIKGKDWERFYLRRPESSESLAFNPHIVVISLGINDVMAWDALSPEFAESYAEIIRAYRELPQKPRILIASPLAPLLRGHSYFNDPNVTEVNAAVAEVASAHNVEAFDLAGAYAQPWGLFADFVHPNARGAGVFANTVYAALTRDIERHDSDRVIVEEFEIFPAGPLQHQSSSSGNWSADGNVEVSNRFRYEGFHSLRLLGGTGCAVTWTPEDTLGSGSDLSFWAARWTARGTLAMRVEARDEVGEWSEVWGSNHEVLTVDEQTKNFRTFVHVRLEKPATAIRVTCNANDNTGILIDTWKVARPMPETARAAIAQYKP